MSETHLKIFNQAEEAVQAIKEKQFRLLALLLCTLISFPIALGNYRIFALGIGGVYETILPTLAYFSMLLGLLPSRIISFSGRKALLVTGLAMASFSPLITRGTIGSGFIALVLDAFIIHYFFSRKRAGLLIGALVLGMFIVITGQAVGWLPPVALPEASELTSFALIKGLAVILLIVIFHVMNNRSSDALKRSILSSIASEKNLQKEKTATSEYLESIPGLFFLFNEKWELERWNRNLEVASGYSKEELSGKDLMSFFEKDQRSRFRKSISDVFLKGTTYTEGNLVRKDGTRKPFAFTGKSINVEGEIRACGIGIDLTEKKRLEKEVQEAQKMEAIGTLASGVAHDLNNILGGIIGYAEIIKFTIEDNEMPHKDHVDVVLDCCDRASGIVKQILMFSRKTEEKKISLEMRSVVRDALALIRQTVPKSIEIREYLPREKSTVLADINQVHQVIINICTNAWHSMRETGGVLTVSTGCDDVGAEAIPDKYSVAPGFYQKVTISDTGTGIPKDLIETIFNPFFTTKPEGEGTGLGLAVVDKILRNHDGFLTVTSSEKKGTTFSVYFPVHNQIQMLKEESSAQALASGTETILVVDDEPAIRDAYQIILSDLGYTVLVAENGQEGLTQFKNNSEQIALIITDLSMPKLNGSTMALRIRESVPDLPILLCTGYSEAIESRQLRSDHFTARIHKPLRRDSLSKVVRKLIDGEKLDAGVND